MSRSSWPIDFLVVVASALAVCEDVLGFYVDIVRREHQMGFNSSEEEYFVLHSSLTHMTVGSYVSMLGTKV
jgi:hypothetical protein